MLGWNCNTRIKEAGRGCCIFEKRKLWKTKPICSFPAMSKARQTKAPDTKLQHLVSRHVGSVPVKSSPLESDETLASPSSFLSGLKCLIYLTHHNKPIRDSTIHIQSKSSFVHKTISDDGTIFSPKGPFVSKAKCKKRTLCRRQEAQGLKRI